MAAATTQPTACLLVNDKEAELVKAGVALFNSPSLLGGQAAKAGLSCSSCHNNGRDNPHFQVEGLSSTAGTADVTSSFFSVLRSNALNDAVVIPDLAKPGKISRSQNDGQLERFIRTLIVEEFSGAEPNRSTLSALAGYVRSLRNCENSHTEDRRLKHQITLTIAAVDGAVAMQHRGEFQTARSLVRAARHQLGLIDERYATAHFKVERQKLLESSIRLQKIGDSEDATQFIPAITKWRSDFDNHLAPHLIAGEPQSLYDNARFQAALNRIDTTKNR